MKCPTCGAEREAPVFIILSTAALILIAVLVLTTLQAISELQANVTLLRQTDFSLRQAVYQNWHRGVPQPPR